jgi:hypothetical protein
MRIREKRSIIIFLRYGAKPLGGVIVSTAEKSVVYTIVCKLVLRIKRKGVSFLAIKKSSTELERRGYTHGVKRAD